MKILGIDPGTQIMGYGLVEAVESGVTLLGYGVLKASRNLPVSERLGCLYNELFKIIAGSKPDAVAIERPFVAKNAQSALAIGKAQAVAILAAVNQNIPSYEYTPAQVKQRVANYGASSKEQIQEMVRLHLGLAELPQPNDAADALAVAICHFQETHLERMAQRQTGETG